MKTQPEYDKINASKRIICPGCRRPSKQRLRPDTQLVNFPLWCPFCRREYVVNIEPCQSLSASAN